MATYRNKLSRTDQPAFIIEFIKEVIYLHHYDWSIVCHWIVQGLDEDGVRQGGLDVVYLYH